MLSLPHQLRVFAAVEPADMRKQCDGLWAVARDHLGEDPKGGALFEQDAQPPKTAVL
ncbi:hypothetical protein [Ruficoccus amylovorans]|uniref:hypothetical protein n=1 Tax=Ruficoccus amylovorans TaxID=1804625 RepID=UPI001FE5B0AB|nr:hypothetical protein [Ruficoccus amylovorans]